MALHVKLSPLSQYFRHQLAELAPNIAALKVFLLI